MEAELRANEVIVRDFSSPGSQQHTAALGEHANSEQSALTDSERQQDKSGTAASETTTANDKPAALTDRHAKLPYSRFYSPRWTSQRQPFQESVPPPPPVPPRKAPIRISTREPPPSPRKPTRPSYHVSGGEESSRHRVSNESGTSSSGSRYSTMPHGQQHYRCDDRGGPTPSRRASTGQRVARMSNESRYSTDV